MQSCWNAYPHSRPSFSDIHEKLQEENWDALKFEMPVDKRM